MESVFFFFLGGGGGGLGLEGLGCQACGLKFQDLGYKVEGRPFHLSEVWGVFRYS